MFLIVIILNLLLMKLKRSFYFAVPTSSLTFPVAQRFTSPEFLENSIFRFDVFVSGFSVERIINEKKKRR